MDLTTPAIIGDIVGSYYLKNEGEFYDLKGRIEKGSTSEVTTMIVALKDSIKNKRNIKETINKWFNKIHKRDFFLGELEGCGFLAPVYDTNSFSLLEEVNDLVFDFQEDKEDSKEFKELADGLLKKYSIKQLANMSQKGDEFSLGNLLAETYWCLTQAHSWNEAMTYAINLGGKTNCRCSMVSQLASIIWGIPYKYSDSLKEKLEKLGANDLY